MLIRKRAGAFYVLHVVLLEEKFNALGETRYGCFLCFHHLLQIEFDVANFDTTVLCVVQDLMVHVRVVKEGFGGDAADIEAGSAESAALLYTCYLAGLSIGVIHGVVRILGATYLETGLTSLNRSNVACDTAANDHEILLLCSVSASNAQEHVFELFLPAGVA